jgi:hypothetical protein
MTSWQDEAMPVRMTSAAAAGMSCRWSGLALIGAGLLFVPLVAHPNVLRVGFAAPARQPLWIVMHVAALLAVVLSLFGVAGLVLAQGSRLGRTGRIGAALTVPGLVGFGCAVWYEAVVMPVLVRQDPQLLAWDGPINTSLPFLMTAAVVGLWPLGLLLVAIGTWRARVLPRGAALTLGVGAVTFATFEGVFVPVLGVVAVLVFAAGHAWLGAAVFIRHTAEHPAAHR